ncbi:MAG: hypothetical protein ABJE95_11775 [Byssovorax sp.]
MSGEEDEKKGVTKAAPAFFYYAMFDGTSEVDSVAFGLDLDAKAGVTNWRNLLDLLDRDPTDGARLVDPNHLFLPIYKLDASAAKDAKGMAVICPAGFSSTGQDDMWQGYGGAAGVKFPEFAGSDREVLFGRHAAAEESARFMSSFLIEPVIEIDGAKKRIVSGASGAAKGTLFRASLLYVSSHGWLGGFSRGNMNPAYAAALPKPPPKSTDDPTLEYVPTYAYFAIGKLDAAKKAFRGPEWIVLAQCSTSNVNTWAMWARVLASSNPQVRGVLGYEEASPDAGASVGIANSFFKNLKNKKTFYEAWVAANPGQNWAALVHKDAMTDTLPGWTTRTALAGTTISDYLGSASKAPKQVAVTDPILPYAIDVFHERGSLKWEITPATLDESASMLWSPDDYRVEIQIPGAGTTITQVKIEWIHIRDTFTQVNRNKLFPKITEAEATAKVNLKNTKVVVVDYPTPVARAKITFTAGSDADLKSSGLAAHHSYLWPRIEVTGTGLTASKVDMKTKGINYLG